MIELPIHPFTGLTALAVLPSGRPVWPVIGGAEDDQEQDGEQEQEQDEGGEEQGDDKPLGPAGEKALAAEKEKRKTAEARRRAAEAELAELKKSGADEETRARLEAQEAAIAKANQRILRSEIKAAAAGKLADPADALRLLDLDAFEVGSDGEVDEEAIAEAIDDLISKKPYLAAQGGAAQGGAKFQGTGDGGPRPKPPAKRPTSLGEAVSRKFTR